jgi:hypothetical protein
VQFRIIRNLVRSCVAALCLALLQSWQRLISFVKTTTPPSIPYIDDYIEIAAAALFVSFLMLLFRGSEWISTLLIEKIPLVSPLLRRLVAGSDHVEGDWPLVVVNSKTGHILLEGFLSIDFRNGELYVSGTDWHPADGTVVHEFESIRTTYDKSVLRYFYRQGPSLATASRHGYTEVFFFPLGERAERHAGEFLDKETEIPMRFYAKRLPESSFSTRIQKRSVQRAASKAFRAEIESELARMLAEKALVDWA